MTNSKSSTLVSAAGVLVVGLAAIVTGHFIDHNSDVARSSSLIPTAAFSYRVTPTSGDAPLAVLFSVTDMHQTTRRQKYRIDFGDGSNLTDMNWPYTTTACSPQGCNDPLIISHDYCQSGTYIARLFGPFPICIHRLPEPCKLPNLGTPIAVTTIVVTHSPTTAAPVLRSVSPSGGYIGDRVTISGSGFTSAGNDIHFGSGRILPNVRSIDSTTLTFILPRDIGHCRFIAVCPAPGEDLLPGGEYEIYITNAKGHSNFVDLDVEMPLAPSGDSASHP